MLGGALLVAIVLRQGDALDGGRADAVVVLHLDDRTGVDTARQDIVHYGVPAWQARTIGESNERDDETTLTLSLPGSNLDAAVAWLRNGTNTHAVEETVNYSVDPDQLEPTPLSSGGSAPPDPVRLEVRIVADREGAGAMVLGTLFLVIVTAAVGAVVWRRYRAERQPA